MSNGANQYQQQLPQYQQQRKGSGGCGGCGVMSAVGCVVVVLLALAIVFMGWWAVKSVVVKYTDTKSLNLPVSDASDDEAKALFSRMRTFGDAVKADQPVEPLELTARDINTYIQKSPNATGVLFQVYFNIEGSQIMGQVSIPLELFTPMLKGRWLNGAGTFKMQMTQQRFFLFLESMKVKDEQVSERVMKDLRQKNLMEGANQNPDLQQVLAKIEAIDVRDGKLVITPKKTK